MGLKDRDARFIYFDPPTKRERLETRISKLFSYKAWEKLALFALFIPLLILIGLTQSITKETSTSWLTVAIWIMIGCAPWFFAKRMVGIAYANTSPDRSEDWPSLILSAENLTNPFLMRLDNFVWLRFWYSKDVREQIQEALLLKLPNLTKKREGGWLLSVRFKTKPSSGQLGIGVTW
jgi:hypothetical protein